MALLDDTRNGTNKPLVLLKPKIKDSEKRDLLKPYLGVLRKNEEGKYVAAGQAAGVVGRVKRINPTEKEWKTSDGKTETNSYVEVYLDGEEETYKLDLSYTIAARTLFSRLCNLEEGDNVEISIWRDSEGYIVYNLKQNGKTVPRKYVKEDLPAVQEVKNGKETIKLYGPLNEFFNEKLKELSEKLGKKPAKVIEKAESAVEDLDDSDIPF